MKGLREAIEVEWDMMNDEVDACDCHYIDGVCVDCDGEEDE
jgi:hypothetical protein|tara:strand:+ start:827 stop:949 length:123 start_codon:yes stop_codon:yes gene_type:complete